MTRPEHLEQGLAHRRHSVNTCGMVPRRPQDKSPVQQLAPCLSHLAHSRPSIPFTFPTFPQSQPPLPQRTPPGPPHPVCLCTSMPWLERFHLPRHPSSPPPGTPINTLLHIPTSFSYQDLLACFSLSYFSLLFSPKPCKETSYRALAMCQARRSHLGGYHYHRTDEETGGSVRRVTQPASAGA